MSAGPARSYPAVASPERQTDSHPTTFLPPSPWRSPSPAFAAHSQPEAHPSSSAPPKPPSHLALELDEHSFASLCSLPPPSPNVRVYLPLFESMSSVHERWQSGARVRQAAGAGSLWGDDSESEDAGGEYDATASVVFDDEASYMAFVGVGGWSDDDDEVEAKVAAGDRSRADGGAVAGSGSALDETGPASSGSANGNSAVAALELLPDNPSNASIHLSSHDNEATPFVSPICTPPTTTTLELAPRLPRTRRRSRNEFESPAPPRPRTPTPVVVAFSRPPSSQERRPKSLATGARTRHAPPHNSHSPSRASPST